MCAKYLDAVHVQDYLHVSHQAKWCSHVHSILLATSPTHHHLEFAPGTPSNALRSRWCEITWILGSFNIQLLMFFGCFVTLCYTRTFFLNTSKNNYYRTSTEICRNLDSKLEHLRTSQPIASRMFQVDGCDVLSTCFLQGPSQFLHLYGWMPP